MISLPFHHELSRYLSLMELGTEIQHGLTLILENNAEFVTNNFPYTFEEKPIVTEGMCDKKAKISKFLMVMKS